MSLPIRLAVLSTALLLLAPDRWAVSAPVGERHVPPAVELVDSLGLPLGDVIGGSLANGRATVTLRADGQLYLVKAGRSAFFEGTAAVGFEAPGCAGPPLLFDFEFPLGLTPRSGVAPDGTVLAETGAPASRTLASLWDPFQSPACQPAGQTVTAYSTTALVPAGTFVPPFQARLRPPAGAGPARREPGPPVVVDAIGQVLGPAYDDGIFVVILRDGRGAPLGINIDGGAFSGSLSGVGFESTDCTGPPLVTLLSTHSLFPVTGIGPGRLLHGAVGPPFTATIRSFWRTVLETCDEESPHENPARNTTVLMDLGRFVLPLRLR